MLTVEAGTMLEWLNNEVASHKIISGTLTKGLTNAFYSNEIEPNDKFTFDTSSPGTYALKTLFGRM
jgi:plastocyanin